MIPPASLRLRQAWRWKPSWFSTICFRHAVWLELRHLDPAVLLEQGLRRQVLVRVGGSLHHAAIADRVDRLLHALLVDHPLVGDASTFATFPSWLRSELRKLDDALSIPPWAARAEHQRSRISRTSLQPQSLRTGAGAPPELPRVCAGATAGRVAKKTMATRAARIDGLAFRRVMVQRVSTRGRAFRGGARIGKLHHFGLAVLHEQHLPGRLAIDELPERARCHRDACGCRCPMSFTLRARTCRCPGFHPRRHTPRGPTKRPSTNMPS